MLVLIAFGTIHAQNTEGVEVPEAVSDYVAKNYPEVMNVRYTRRTADRYFRLRETHLSVYAAYFIDKDLIQRLELSENGQLLVKAEEIALNEIPRSARSYIKRHYKNATVLYAERKYLFINGDCFTKSSSRKYYRINISYDRFVEWKNEYVTRFEWAEFNQKRQYVMVLDEI